jgi:hypothetical protein
MGANSGAVSAPIGPLALSKSLPLRGTLEGLLTSSVVTPPFVTNLTEGTGHATHLGRFTLEIPHVVNMTTRIATGTYEFTAANGDTLVASYTGLATPITGGLSVVDSATITFGTGRFAGATGSFTVERVFTPSTLVTTGSFTGTILLARP